MVKESFLVDGTQDLVIVKGLKLIEYRITPLIVNIKAARVLRRYPDCNLEALQETYPDVDMRKLLRWKEIRGGQITERDV